MQGFTGLFYNDFRLMKVPQSSHHRLCAHEPRLLGPILLSLVYILKNNHSVEYSPSFSWLMNLIIWRWESPTWMHREPQFLALNGNFCFRGYRFMPQIQPREGRPLEGRIFHKKVVLWAVKAEVLEPRGAAGSHEANCMPIGATEPHLENGNMEH